MSVKARFHLPGLRYNFPLNMFWINAVKQYPDFFREGVEIASCFGDFPISLWNGGRFSNNDQCDAGFIKRVIKSINDTGVPIRYTYTSPIVTAEEVKDPYCNFCMDCANNGMNEVIVFSPILEDYLRNKYPGFKYNSTTCKEIKDADALNAELEKDYKYVVLDYNLNGKWEFLEKLEHKEKLEVLINAICVPACPRRGEHYRTIAQNERIVLKNRTLPPDKQIPLIPWDCEYGNFNTFQKIQGYSTFVTPEQIWEKYIPMGINNFKIEGRTANLFMLIDEYCYYMIKPEHVDEMRHMIIMNLVHFGAISINKPKPGKWP